ATIAAHLDDEPPALPGPFGPVVARALAKDPADRFASAGALGRAAVAAASGEPVEAAAVTRSVARGEAAPTLHAPTRRVASPAPAPGRRLPRFGRVAGLFALVALLAAGAAAAVVALTRGSGTRTGPLTTSEVRATAQAFARAYGH